jgi:hypothetical protein
LNAVHQASIAEKSRIPDTRLRFVVFKNCPVFGSVARGWLDEKESEALCPRTQSAVLQDPVPFGGCIRLWWNMFHEGATFLCALQNGLVPPRTGIVKTYSQFFCFL